MLGITLVAHIMLKFGTVNSTTIKLWSQYWQTFSFLLDAKLLLNMRPHRNLTKIIILNYIDKNLR